MHRSRGGSMEVEAETSEDGFFAVIFIIALW